MDNFEWINRYGELFGIVYVDFKTKKRIPKISAMWYREARCNAVI
jgi:beta-glucosidase